LLLVFASTVDFRIRSGPMIMSLFFPRLCHVLKWGLLIYERKGLMTTGHSPSTWPHSVSLRTILILFSHLRVGLPSGLWPSGVNTKTQCILHFLRSHSSWLHLESC
jgi:hypothetical protein